MWSDEAPIWVYGDDGPAFVRLCPNCKRFLKMPETITWKESWDGICTFPKIDCSKCGPIEADHIGWAGDFQ
jgi:hypothetical protein